MILSQCKQSLEFIIVALCQAFSFAHPRDAAKFISSGPDSARPELTSYSLSLQDTNNFNRINRFLNLLQSNLNHLKRILTIELDISQVALDSPIFPSDSKEQYEDTSLFIVMNLLILGLSQSVDIRIVQ